MSNTNYLDELDGLLDNPNDSIIDIPAAPAHTPISSAAPSSDPAHTARDTWAAVIENASHSLQEGTRTVQDAAYKNLELAKSQNESIKELIDAASGWRHATRQAVQEVASAKKNVILLTVISGIIAVAGFGTTIGVMLQSRTGLASMSNAVLENVDEHQTLVSRTLTLKMDEMAATIERMENVIDQMGNPDTGKTQAKARPSTSETDNEANAQAAAEAGVESNVALDMILPIEKSIAAQETKTAIPAATTALAIAPPPSSTVVAPPATTMTSAQINDAVTNATTPLNKQMSEKLIQVTGQMTQLEQSWKQSNETVQKQLSLIPSAVEEKLVPRLHALQKATPATPVVAPPTGTTTVVTQDNKAVLEQLSRLRQDLAEIRQLQTSLKEQVNRLNQNQGREPAPYQYRNPEVERYPH